jgi:hypothetical protein
MIAKIWLPVLACIVVAAGGWYVYHGTETAVPADTQEVADNGTYAYTCDNGSNFSMTPSEDMAEVVLTAGSQGMFTGTVTLHKMGDGNHYETAGTASPLIVFSGAGEEARLMVGIESTSCDPVPNAETAPWNWGDAAEGGGMSQDLATIVSESILGTWQSTTDTKSIREFQAGGRVQDRYDGTVVASGTYQVFTDEKPLEVSFPLTGNTPYMRLTMSGTQSETLDLKVINLTLEELGLVYMDRGGVLLYTRVQ